MALVLLALVADRSVVVAAAEQKPPIARQNCPDKCGDISVPFPFGIGPGCFLAQQFEVYCNDSATPPRAFLASTTDTSQKTAEASVFNATAPLVLNESAIPPSPIELVDVTVASNELRAYGAVSSYCSKSAAEQVLRLQLTTVEPSKTLWPLTLSMKRNALVGVGVNVEARLASHMYMDSPNSDSWLSTSCASQESIGGRFYSPMNGSCSGFGCCQVPFAGSADDPDAVPRFAVSFKPSNGSWGGTNPCSYGMVVESSWYNFSTPDLYGYEALSTKLQRGVPFVVDFAVMAGQNGSCPAEGQQPPPGYACASDHSICTNTSTSGDRYVCQCKQYYEATPTSPMDAMLLTGSLLIVFKRIPNHYINECDRPDLYPCSIHGDCKNRPEGYDCPCKRGMKGDGKADTCKEIFPLIARVIVDH
uniref:EGF-like domain-containing protein n=1 Tax=Oryza brachyantha TaxID=4533 RepID=J3L8J1_ORYBR